MWRPTHRRLPVAAVIGISVLLTVLPLALLTWFSIHLAGDAVRREATAKVRSTATLGAFSVESELRRLVEVVESYAARPHFVEAVGDGAGGGRNRATIARHLRELHDARSGISVAFLADPKGILIDIVPETPSIVGDDFSFRDWYKGVTRTRRPYVSEAYVTQATGNARVVGGAVLVRDGAGEDLGILVAAYSLDYIQRFVDGFARTQDVGLRVTDHRGVVVAEPGATPRALLSRRSDPAVAAALAGGAGAFEREGDGGRILAAYAPVRAFGWTVTAEVRTEDAFAGVVRLRNAVLALAALLGIALLAGVVLLARTLWERDRAERALAGQNEELRSVDRMKDEFVSLVSHELRTPLTSIVGYLELLRDDADRLDGEHRQFVDVIERNARRLLKIVGDLLTVARIDAQRLVLQRGAVDLHRLASDAVTACAPAAEERDLVIELIADASPTVDGDRDRLGQVVDNLVSNAVKFTPAGGRVEVRVGTSNEHATLVVSDNGIGIPEAEQGRMFERFFRTSSAADRAISGTGLGLSITQALVAAHGGRISFDSAEGVGTTFTVELPLRQEETR